MNNLALAVPLEFVVEEMERLGIIIPGLPSDDKLEIVRPIVNFILRESYETHYNPQEMNWDPENAPQGLDCLVMYTNGRVVGLATARKVIGITMAKGKDVWMGLETQEEIRGIVVAYKQYEISTKSIERALAVYHGKTIESSF